MIKHIVTIEARNPHEVTIQYDVTDGNKTAHAVSNVSAYIHAYEVILTCGGRFNVRIIDQAHHNAICKQVKREAMEHFHGEVTTEIRMNEG